MHLGMDGVFHELQGAPRPSDSCGGLHHSDHTSHSPQEGAGIVELKSRGAMSCQPRHHLIPTYSTHKGHLFWNET